jgi:VWFA-related protein
LTESSDNRGLFVIFSDGLDVSSWLTADQVLDSARRSEGVVYAVSVGRDGPRPDFLRLLAEATGGSLLEAESTGNLKALFVGILDEFRLRYLLSYSPSATTAGWHDIEVRVRRPDVTVRARPGYVSSGR